MFDIFLLDENFPFTIALTVALLIGVVELINIFIGGITDWFDTLLPEKDIHFGEFSVTDYLCIGRIPLLMWLVVFLCSYGLSGVIIQSILHMNVTLAGILVLFISLIPTRYISLFLHKVLPQDETTALYSESFIGATAVIVSGTAKHKYPAQAKFTDIHGQTHYIMVEPDDENNVYNQGTEVILVSQEQNSTFKCSTI